MDDERQERDFPISAGLLFGLGLGGFFDGIVLHQVLQWREIARIESYYARFPRPWQPAWACAVIPRLLRRYVCYPLSSLL